MSSFGEKVSYVDAVLESMYEKHKDTDYKLSIVKGVPQNPSFDVEKFESIIDTFQARESDVFIATYVKAGTTWTQQIINLLIQGGETEKSYTETVPWLEAVASEFLLPREAKTWTLEKIVDAPGPRYFKTHALVDHLPRGSGKPKVICITRNPKDTLVSLFHHSKSKPEFSFTADFQTFFECFVSGRCENGSWFTHALGWYAECKANPDTHLFLQYEDMCQSPAAAIRKIATHIGIEPTEELVAKVVKNSSISEMRAKQNMGLNHLRQGGYGGWRQYFTVAMNEFFDDVYARKMEGSDLKFNFGPNSHGKDVIF